MRRRLITLATALALGLPGIASAAEGGALPQQQWPFQGLFGTFDRAAAVRGLQVYQEVCAGCHSLSLIAYRNLEALGLSGDQVKALAAAATVTDGPNDQGEMFDRPGRPSDRFVSPFPNPQAARAANNGALPPDLSLMVKARRDGPNYVYGILTGYTEAPAGFNLYPGMNYNAVFPGHQIAMPPPLSDGAVTYPDGTEATLDQMSRDVVSFLAWTAEPELEVRKRTGVKTLLFLIVLTGLFYAWKRKVWAEVH